MAVNDLFKKVPVEIPNKSGFDESHEHFFTSKPGTLVPVMTDLLLPNDTVSLGVSAEIQLPPMATDFYGRVKAHFEQFFVPLRLLYGGWQELIVRTPDNASQSYPSGTVDGQRARYLPELSIPIKEMRSGSLSDYLGYGIEDPSNEGDDWTAKLTVPNPLKYAAYHRIWSDFYRDSRIQAPAFSKFLPNGYNQPSVSTESNFGFATMPYWTSYNSTPVHLSDINAYGGIRGTQCADGVYCYQLRQRNWARDYFTNCTPLPQAGAPAQVAFGISNNQGSFSIASLRAANSLQQWLERNNIAGFRYGDQIRAHFGIYPSDAALDRPLYLGRQIFDVYNKSVFQNDGNTVQSNSNNPFSTVGAKYGSPLGVGSGSLCDKFTASEHGYLMTIFSLVPDAVYSDTWDKDFFYNKSSDFPFPILQGVGDEPVSHAELYGSTLIGDDRFETPDVAVSTAKNSVFGYTQRYAYHKFKLDKVSGLLRDDSNLRSFALQRSFEYSSDWSAGIGTSFLEIPVDYLDQVAAVQGDVSKYGCWVDSHFNYHKVSTLAAYSIPTLGDVKNTHTEVVPNGGVRL